MGEDVSLASALPGLRLATEDALVHSLATMVYDVIDHRGKGMYQCIFCGESKPRLSIAQRHVLAHFFAHHIAQNIDLAEIPEVF